MIATTAVVYPELATPRTDWIQYYNLEEACSDHVSAVQDSQMAMMEESLKTYSAVRSLVGREGTKEEILATLGKSSGSGRTTMNLRYKVGAVFPRNSWLDDAPLFWSHYRAAATMADLNDPDTFEVAQRVLARAAEESMSVTQLEHHIKELRRGKGHNTYPYPVARAAPMFLVSTTNDVFSLEADRAVIERIRRLELGSEMIVTITIQVSEPNETETQ